MGFRQAHPMPSPRMERILGAVLVGLNIGIFAALFGVRLP